MSEPRVIKRYSNRKLYDTERSRYVTLEQVADMIREGHDVRIIDNNSKEDLTSITLAQIIFEEEKRQRSFLPLQAMRNIIQSGGERIEELVSNAQKKVTNVFHRKITERGQVKGEEPVAASAAQGGGEGARENLSKPVRELKEWLATTQRSIDDWQRRMDDRVRHVVEGMSPLASLHKEVSALATRIAELEKKLAEAARAEERK